MSESIIGYAKRVGTMNVDGEELTGIFVEVRKEDLENSQANILFKLVKVETDL